MADKPIKSGILWRTFELDRASVKDDRTVELSFSSEEPVERWFGTETLDHDPGSVDLTRLNNGGALLVEHDPTDQVGVVESATVGADRKGRALVRFGTSARANEIYEDVKNKIRRLVSVGYRIRKMVLEKEEDGVEHYRATSWTPLELSIVAVPADASVGVGRIGNTDETEILVEHRNMKTLLEPGGGGGGGTTVTASTTILAPQLSVRTESDIVKAERERVREITAIADRLKTDSCRALAKQAIEAGTPLDDFRGEVLTKEFNAKPVEVTPQIGMSAKELKRYSIVNGIRSILTSGKLDGIEKEAHDAAAKQYKLTPSGERAFFLPFDVEEYRNAEALHKRVLQVGTFTGAGALVDTALDTANMIELYRNQMYVVQMGARSLAGLVGDVAIPRHTGGATTYWLGETATLTASDQAVGQLTLKPHRLAAATAYTNQLLAQSSLDVESFVRTDLAEVIALEKDDTSINGSGVSGEPLGIKNTTGVLLVTIAAANSATYAQAVSFETALALQNALKGRLGFLCHPTFRNNARLVQRFSSTDTPLWKGGETDATYIDYSARSTLQVTAGAIFGRWDDLILADWAGTQVIVDPYSLSLSNQVRIILQLMTDVGVRHAVSFGVSTT